MVIVDIRVNSPKYKGLRHVWTWVPILRIQVYDDPADIAADRADKAPKEK